LGETEPVACIMDVLCPQSSTEVVGRRNEKEVWGATKPGKSSEWRRAKVRKGWFSKRGTNRRLNRSLKVGGGGQQTQSVVTAPTLRQRRGNSGMSKGGTDFANP